MYFADTNICIYYLKGKFISVEEHFKNIPLNEIKIPVIVKAELLFGIEKSKQKDENKTIFNSFIKAFEVVNLNDKTLDYYAKIRNELEHTGNIIGANDLFIASIVLAYNGILVTNNTNEFERIKGLKIENWVK
ncbi:MAG: type II toxin-antitoxin system VapC family toxin [Spirochaetaceae bacterium]|jgi:tRNA(fMet)-specific endonuclease VapC|nr:type II toxin-antitoxin system VapC family toxin [Spirochaetaceae bacterium]